MRKLIIFGNGIGRSLNNNFFMLERGLREAWYDETILKHEDRELINICRNPSGLVEEFSGPPEHEDELDDLQRVVAACDVISIYDKKTEAEAWLSNKGRRFPYVIRSFIHKAASSYCNGPHALPAEFRDSLLEYFNRHRCHIATLNYDDLLYQAFAGTTAFDGYNGLIDGFWKTRGGFDPSNLNRFKKQQQSFYLHLHGSPLYYDLQNGETHKAQLSEVRKFEGHSSTHIVLTHIEHKRSVINASPVLSEYWKRLVEALEEVSGVILFGYSGGDTHLNELLRLHASHCQIEVIERSDEAYRTASGSKERIEYWRGRVGKEPAIVWLDDILKHRNWAWQAGGSN